MNTTFILGAGFSVEAGFPLVRDLKGRCLRFIEFDRHPVYAQFLNPGNGGFAEGQFQAGLKEIDPDGKLAFEELLWELKNRVRDREYDGPCVQAEWTLRIGCSRLLWCIHGLNPFAGSCYRNFANWLGHSGAQNYIVSFNWDVLVETALQQTGLTWSYCLPSPGIAVLKPHGSINWNGYLRESAHNDFGLWTPIAQGSKLSYPSQIPLFNPGQQEVNPDFRYVLFPGDPDLPEADPDLKLIWKDIEQAVANSERIIFIGYSLPDYDSFASEFFKERTQGKNIEVYNPSSSDQQKYVRLFGGRLTHQDATFSSSPFAQ